MSAPHHGDTRSTGTRTRYGEDVTYTHAVTGEVLFQGASSVTTESVGEFYCLRCGGWQPYAGVMGALFAKYTCPTCGAPANLGDA